MVQLLSVEEEAVVEEYSQLQHRKNNLFGKNSRIVDTWEFAQFKQSSERLPRRNLTIVLKKKRLATPRLGIITSRKVGSAVIRNKFRRLIRQFFRTTILLNYPYDVLVIAKRDISILSYNHIYIDMSVIIKGER